MTALQAVHQQPPQEISVTPARDALIIHWAEGTQSLLSATLLRAHSRSSDAERARIDGLTPADLDNSLHLTGVTAIGQYAINITFSDGHDRGIYPWSYLRALANGGDGSSNLRPENDVTSDNSPINFPTNRAED